MSEPNAKVLLSREEDSHPQASGRLMVWRSSELDANRVANRDLHDVTPRKASRQQVLGAEGDYEDDLLSSDTDPQPGYVTRLNDDGTRKFLPVRFLEKALKVIASKELYDELDVHPDARLFFTSVRPTADYLAWEVLCHADREVGWVVAGGAARALAGHDERGARQLDGGAASAHRGRGAAAEGRRVGGGRDGGQACDGQDLLLGVRLFVSPGCTQECLLQCTRPHGLCI